MADTNSALNLPDALNEPLSRQEQFVRNLFIEPSVMLAAIKAGYSESYANSQIYQSLRSPKLQERIREYARTHELVDSIPTIMRLEHNALKYLEDKPQELPKFSALLKQKKQIAGLLSQDAVPQQPMININQVANLMLNVNQAPLHIDVEPDNVADIITVDSK